MPPVNFVTLHDDLVAILAAIEAADLGTLAVELREHMLLENRKFEWLHDQNPLEPPVTP